ncbi:MAG: DUF1569 domain-containing protein [Gemmatimonadales bacterium]|nr:DUF1569 domain-containing protein [Gemmatimonadales bacterium]NIN10653.1 DUF1569 domain-containing protein [Gemmatimonadales bacterium]NIN49415.1 DUF1569 domain-containing protein [Gemmatimonadales bacterium]NIP06879.1 DUF1569 domain-containing protein [Gemmatimonadales bacterium]NIR01553.1 DUF1569 domain-containing protein [Gemmatimonadales bacterium]
MKVTRQLARLESLVLNPLRGLSDDEWHRAPKGKWTVAQIVEHLSISVDLVAGLFEKRANKKGMRRRATPVQGLLRHLILGLETIPPGLRAPEAARPSEKPDPELMLAQFRMGVERLKAFVEQWPEERQLQVFVRHPLLGDLNLPEWVRFHYLHNRHHARQMEDRLEWARKQ